MFEVDLRLNVAPELTPGGQSGGGYEWYGFRGKTLSRDRLGRPTYVRGVAINLDQRYRAQQKLIDQKIRQLQNARNQADYCAGVIQEVSTFIRNLAENADTLLAANDDPRVAEDRLMRLTSLKDQAGHILELTDKVRYYIGQDNEQKYSQDVQPLALWEHMAEQQQVYSLKAGNQMRFYFANLYDNREIYVDVKLFNVLLDNVINALIRSNTGGCITISYTVDEPTETLRIMATYSGQGSMSTVSADGNAAYSMSTLGQSVSRLIAKRMWGDITAETGEQDRLRYVITLPLDARKPIMQAFPSRAYTANEEKKDLDLLDELKLEREAENEALMNSRAALPQVLIGLSSDASLYRNQHLFEVLVTRTTDELADSFTTNDPHIVFVDSHLPGTLSVNDLITRLHRQSPDTPIIVTDDTAPRHLHKQVQQLGARYLLNNPLTLRKVNMMIKKYLK